MKGVVEERCWRGVLKRSVEETCFRTFQKSVGEEYCVGAKCWKRVL